jgi:hypothetical protein
MIKQIIKTKDQVKSLLEMEEGLRDNDTRLIAIYWAYEIGIEQLKGLSANDFLANVAAGKLTPADTITRARRKVQEDNEELRGVKYKKRKAAAEQLDQEKETDAWFNQLGADSVSDTED